MAAKRTPAKSSPKPPATGRGGSGSKGTKKAERTIPLYDMTGSNRQPAAKRRVTERDAREIAKMSPRDKRSMTEIRMYNSGMNVEGYPSFMPKTVKGRKGTVAGRAKKK